MTQLGIKETQELIKSKLEEIIKNLDTLTFDTDINFSEETSISEIVISYETNTIIIL